MSKSIPTPISYQYPTGKKEEGRRLREFVEAAYKMDPRVIRKKEEEKAERWAGCGLLFGGGAGRHGGRAALCQGPLVGLHMQG